MTSPYFEDTPRRHRWWTRLLRIPRHSPAATTEAENALPGPAWHKRANFGNWQYPRADPRTVSGPEADVDDAINQGLAARDTNAKIDGDLR